MSWTTNDFLRALFGLTSEENHISLSALDNERGGPLQTRENTFGSKEGILKFLNRYGAEPGRGTFFCVGTVKPGAKRLKANIQEIVCLHADIDFKDIEEDRATVEKRLAQLPIPPSITVFSGNGIHAYWLLKEPIVMDSSDAIERVEESYKRLSVMLAADMHVCQVAALMRLPGSHNTKQGKMTPVEVLTFDSERRFELDDIEEQMLDVVNPIFARKDRTQSTPEDNPFTRIAELNGIKPRTDVDGLVALMAPGNVHASQVKITSSLLSRGEMTPDEVVEFTLRATMAMSDQLNLRYKESIDRRKIRGMCDSWLKKHPELIERKVVQLPPPKAAPKQTLTREPDEAPPSGPGEVISLAQKRKERAPQAAKKEKDIHVKLARTVIDVMRERGEDILITEETLWRYRDSIWSSAGDGKAWLDAQVQTACEALEIVPANKLVSEARQYILRNETIRRELPVSWDAHGKVPTRSGLIDPRTGELERALAGHYCTWRMPIDYDPEAACPWWLQMLEDVFEDRDQRTRAAVIAVIQEHAGAGMIDRKHRNLTKALLLEGGANAGKSGVLEVLGGVYGCEHATEIGTIKETHGLMPFMTRSPWVLHEAFEQGMRHDSGKLKAIVTGEPVNINPKNQRLFNKRITAPIFWGTNHPAKFREATAAISSRFNIIACKREFREDEPVGAAIEALARGFGRPAELVLADEMPGLLNWALAGLARALERGRIAVPDEVAEASQALRDDGNLVAGFVADCINFNPYVMLPVPDFRAAFLIWFAQEKGEGRRTPTDETITAHLKALTGARVAINPKEMRKSNCRYYGGIELNDYGLKLHQAALHSDLFRDRIIGTTIVGDSPNTTIDNSWNEKPSIKAMRMAQKGPVRGRDTHKKGCHADDTDALSSEDGVSSPVTSPQVTEPQGKPRF